MAGAFIILFCVTHSLLQDVLCETRVLFSKSELLISGTWIMNSHSVFALIFSLLLALFCVKCRKCKGSSLFWIWSNGLRFIKFKLALSNKLYMKLKSSLNGKKGWKGTGDMTGKKESGSRLLLGFTESGAEVEMDGCKEGWYKIFMTCSLENACLPILKAIATMRISEQERLVYTFM